eukprot:9775585-Alexandrium_andersonii.AAC.1
MASASCHCGRRSTDRARRSPRRPGAWSAKTAAAASPRGSLGGGKACLVRAGRLRWTAPRCPLSPQSRPTDARSMGRQRPTQG